MSHYLSLLNTTVALYSSSTSSNSLGQTVETMVYVNSGVAARLVPMSNEIKSTLPGKFVNTKYIAYFQPSANISEDYQVKYDNNYYKILDYMTDCESITQKAYLQEVDL